jgi:hypothetical protein
MRGPDKIVLMVALALPLLIAGVGWPMVVRWVGGSPPTPSPETTGAAAPSVATAGVGSTPGPATAQPAARTAAPANPRATAGPAATQVPRANGAAAADTGPSAAVASFYELVGRHQFATAAQLWSPRMRAAFPPADNIDRRFGQTQQVVVNRAEVVSMNGDQATVAVDLVELDTAGQRHYVGTWSVVRSPDGWLLDQPNLQAAP